MQVKASHILVSTLTEAQAGEAYLLRPDVYHSVTTPVDVRKFITTDGKP